MIKDIGTRFTALATGKIHYMGEGSWSMTPGQAQQALRDFPDRIVINNQLNHWARTIVFGAKFPWTDVRARKAVHLALDRDEWLAFYSIPGYEGMKLAHTMAPGTFYAPTEEEIRTWPGYRQPKDEDIAEAKTGVAVKRRSTYDDLDLETAICEKIKDGFKERTPGSVDLEGHSYEYQDKIVLQAVQIIGKHEPLAFINDYETAALEFSRDSKGFAPRKPGSSNP